MNVTDTDIVERLDTLARSARAGARAAENGWSDMDLACHLQREADALDAAKAQILSLRTSLEEAIRERDEARERVDALEIGLGTGLAEIKDELNGLAMMGAVPLWGSFIGRLDDLATSVLGSGERGA